MNTDFQSNYFKFNEAVNVLQVKKIEDSKDPVEVTENLKNQALTTKEPETNLSAHTAQFEKDDLHIHDLFKKAISLQIKGKVEELNPDESHQLKQMELELLAKQYQSLTKKLGDKDEDEIPDATKQYIDHLADQFREKVESQLKASLNDNHPEGAIKTLLNILKTCHIEDPKLVATLFQNLLNELNKDTRKQLIQDLHQFVPNEKFLHELVIRICDPSHINLIPVIISEVQFTDHHLYIDLLKSAMKVPSIQYKPEQALKIFSKIPTASRKEFLKVFIQSNSLLKTSLSLLEQYKSDFAEAELKDIFLLITVINHVGYNYMDDAIQDLISKSGLNNHEFYYDLALQSATYSLDCAYNTITWQPDNPAFKDPEKLMKVLLAGILSNKEASSVFDKFTPALDFENHPERKMVLAKALAESTEIRNNSLIQKLDLTEAQINSVLPFMTKNSGIRAIALGKVTDPNQAFQMLKINLMHNPEGFIQDLREISVHNKFNQLLDKGVLTPKHLVELIKLAAEHDPGKTFDALSQLQLSMDDKKDLILAYSEGYLLAHFKKNEVEFARIEKTNFHLSGYIQSTFISSFESIRALLDPMYADFDKFTPNPSDKEKQECLKILEEKTGKLRKFADITVSEDATIPAPIIPELKALLDKADKIDNLLIRHNTLLWIANLYAGIKFYGLSVDEQKKHLVLINTLMDYRDPQMRQLVTGFVFEHLAGKVDSGTYTAANPEIIISQALLASMGMDKPAVQKFLELLKNEPKFLKDANKAQTLNTMLYDLATSPHLTEEEKQKVLMALLNSPKTTAEGKKGGAPGKEVSLPDLDSMQAVSDLLALGEYQKLIQLSNRQDFQPAIQGMFREKFPMDTNRFEAKYDATFNKWRSKNAIFTYLGKIQKLPKSQRDPLMQVYQTFIADVFEGRFPSSRYDVNNPANAHIKLLFDKHPDMFARWKDGMQFDMNELSTASQEARYPIGERLTNAILKENALGEDGEKKYPRLFQALKAEDPKAEAGKRIRALNEEIENESKNMGALKDKNAKAELSKKLFELRKERTILLNCSSHLNLGRGESRDQASAVAKLFEGTALATEIQNKLKTTTAAKNPLTLFVSDNPNDLMLMGTEIENSCQNVAGDPSLNKCLMGYVPDGKNKLLVVKDGDGKMVGRIVLRVIYNDDDEPYLFRERVYANRGAQQSEARSLLLQGFEKFGNYLQMPTATAELEEDEPKEYLEENLKSLGSPAPFEYKDAIGAPHFDTVYTLAGNIYSLKEAHYIKG